MCGPCGQFGGSLVAGGRLGRMVRADGFESWGGLAVGLLGCWGGWALRGLGGGGGPCAGGEI